MGSLIVDISISAEAFQRLYTGSARTVLARARDGRRVKFPAQILRPFVTHEGVHGRFRIEFDERNSFKAVKKID